jgi:hypothetical protein
MKCLECNNDFPGVTRHESDDSPFVCHNCSIDSAIKKLNQTVTYLLDLDTWRYKPRSCPVCESTSYRVGSSYPVAYICECGKYYTDNDRPLKPKIEDYVK